MRGVGVIRGQRTQSATASSFEPVTAQPQGFEPMPAVAGWGVAIVVLSLAGSLGVMAIRRRRSRG
jgi:hypothetical protein